MFSPQPKTAWRHIALALSLTPVSLHAASFTQGHVVVQQAAAASTNTTISLIEVDTAATSTQVSPVQTIALPGTTYPSNAFRINGSGGTTGYLATTNDGTLLCLDAHNATTSADITPTAANILPRAVLAFPATGVYQTSTTYTGGTGNQARGATSLDNSHWFIADKGGIYTNGGVAPAGLTSNVLAVKSFGGTVYMLQAAAPAVSTLASITSTSATGLSGLSALAGPTDFYLISSGVNGATFDVLYTATGTSATVGTIGKYSLVGGTWVANGTYTTNFGGSRMVAAGNGNGATLYVTAGIASAVSNAVMKLTDTASYNTAIAITTANNVNLYTVPGVAKGIAFAPLASSMADLTVSVSAPSTGVTGSNFNYTLTVANSGTANATVVGVQFTLPSGLTYVSAADTGSAGFSGTSTSGVISFSGGTLNAGTSETLTVTVSAASDGTYAAAAGSALVDPAHSIAESNENNNTSPVATSTVVGSYPDLTVDVSGPATAATGSNYNYTLSLHNIGNAGATGIAAQFTLPAGLTFVSATDGGGNGFSGVNSSGVVTFTGGSLTQGASDTLTVTVSSATATTYNVAAGAAVINPAHAISESNFANNASVSAVSTAVTAPDLTVRCEHSGSFAPGDAADTYSIYVTNNGANSTNGSAVTVAMTLPVGLTPTAADNGTLNGWTVSSSGQTVTATRSDALAANASYPVLTVTVAVNDAASGSLAATVNVSGGGDISTGNDSITGAVNVSVPSPITSAGNLIVSRSVYTGTGATVPFPGKLPNGADSVVDGSYPSVWGNETPDAAFGVTSPIFLDQITKSGTLVSSVALTTAVSTQLGLDVSTSFPSKSELALNLTPDSTGLTFMCYLAPANALDASNTDTPYHVDPTNPITGIGTRQRAIVQFDYLGNVQVTPVSSYSGNNGRAAVLAGGNYFTVGNAGNGSGSATVVSMLSDDTGLQMIAPGAGGTAQAVGTTFGTNGTASGYQHGFSLANIPGFLADKTGKDMNLRGLTINPFTNTLFVSKGSGGNGINTVYQVGTGGIPTPDNATSLTFTIPPGFSETNTAGKDASGASQTVYYPFGMWFGDANTMYVADEGNPTSIPTTYDAASGQFTSALPVNNPTGGLQKWVFDGSKWNLVYTLINGLNLGQPFIVPGYPTGINSATGLPWNPANNGLRNITGKVNGNGTVTIYAVTSTVSGGTDQGADPNQLVTITDTLSTTTLPGSESFTIIKTAGNMEVLRGVSFAPHKTNTPLEDWRLTYFGTLDTNGNYANNADYNHDGVENLMKYALGINPISGFGSAGVAALPAKIMNDADPLLSDRLGLHFNIASPNPSDITYTVQATDDLGSWTDVASKTGAGAWTWLAGGTSRIVTSGNGPVSVKIGDSVPADASHPKRMMRLKVTNP